MTWIAILIGLAMLVGLSLGGADWVFAASMQTGLYAIAAVAVLALPVTRAAAVDALWRHRFGVLALGGLIVYAAGAAGGLGGPASSIAPETTGLEAWGFASLGLAALAAAGGAEAAGRHRLVTVLLVAPILLAVAILVDQLDQVGDFFGLVGGENRAGRGLTGPFATIAELGAVFALFLLLGAFAALDEIRRRPTPGSIGFPPLSQRLLLPVGSILACANILAVSGARGAMAAVVVGVLVLWAVITARLTTGPGSRMPIPGWAAIIAGVVCLGLILIPPGFELMFAANGDARPYAYLAETAARAGAERPWTGFGFGAFPLIAIDLAPKDAVLSGFPIVSGDFAVWRIEAGVVGVSLGLLVLIGFLAPLGLAKDRGRQPSRGFALGVGVVAVCLIAGVPHAVLSNPAIAHLAALLLGLSSSYVDASRRRRTPSAF